MKQYQMMRKSVWILLIVALGVLCGCSRHSQVMSMLDSADAVMETYPDTALMIINDIDTTQLSSTKEKTRYSLLKSMALDRNYIEKTTFETLQPAIDYYQKHGSPDEQLRALYYQGRIFQNQGNYTDAMDRFVEALNHQGITDSVCYARTLVARGSLYYKLYDLKPLIDDNLEAANIFESRRINTNAYESWCRILGASIMLGDFDGARQALNEAERILKKDSSISPKMLNSYRLEYAYSFLPDSLLSRETERVITNLDSSVTEIEVLDLATAYERLGDHQSAKDLIGMLDLNDIDPDLRLKAFAVASSVCENQQDYPNAALYYKKYAETSDSINSVIYSSKLQFAEERHNIEMQLSEEQHEKRIGILVAAIIGLALLLACAVIVLVVVRIRQNKKEYTEKIDLLKTKLMFRYALMNDSIDALKSLFLGELSDNAKMKQEFEDWKHQKSADPSLFMQTNLDFFKLSNPKFHSFLMDSGLTEKEAQIAGLFAIGMSAKEVGAFIKMPSIYNVSATIRKKLLDAAIAKGILPNDTKMNLSKLIPLLLQKEEK